MNSYETVNDVLVKLFHEIMDVEERALITSEYKDISVNDMHVIEAIGIREPKDVYKRQVKCRKTYSGRP